MYGSALSLIATKLNERMHNSLLVGRSPRSFHAPSCTNLLQKQCNHHHQHPSMWSSYIYLKVVVSDEKVPEDSGLVEIAQTDHVFNSLIRKNLVVHNDHNNHDCYDNIDGGVDEIQWIKTPEHMLCTKSPWRMLCASVWFSSPEKATAPPRRRQPPWL